MIELQTWNNETTEDNTMSLEDRVEKLEQRDNTPEQDTIISQFQNRDRCVFCINKNYDSIIFDILRHTYNHKTQKDHQRQDKETCIHHNDDWLKHSYYTGGFIWSAITDHGKKPITNGDMLELFKNKEETEKILTVEYDKIKNFSSATHLYLTDWSKTKEKNRYSESFTIEADIPIQNEIIRNRIKTWYTMAIEALRNFE